jgi:hypothetical protein
VLELADHQLTGCAAGGELQRKLDVSGVQERSGIQTISLGIEM